MHLLIAIGGSFLIGVLSNQIADQAVSWTVAIVGAICWSLLSFELFGKE